MVKILKVRKVGTSLIVTIPKDICELFGIKEGSELEIEPQNTDTFKVKRR